MVPLVEGWYQTGAEDIGTKEEKKIEMVVVIG